MNLTRKTYATRGEKWLDFFIGFGGLYVVSGILWGVVQVVVTVVSSLTINLDYDTASTITSIVGLVCGALPLLFTIAALIFFAFTRYWIALGILAAIAVAFIIAICIAVVIGGICFAALYGYSSMGP